MGVATRTKTTALRLAMEPSSAVDTTSASGATDSTRWMYELVPLFELPELDLSISIKSRFVHSPRLLHYMSLMMGSYFSFIGYLTYMTLTLAVLFVPAMTGRVLALLAVGIGLLPALLAVSMLRYEMIVVLLKTYDIWFFGVLSTCILIIVAMIFDDVRGILMLKSWLHFIFNIFIDANLFNMRGVWIGNVLSVIMYLTMAACISSNGTDNLHQFNVLSTKTNRSLPASSIVRDGLFSMTAVIMRNVVRQRQHLSKRVTPAPSASQQQLAVAAAAAGRPPVKSRLVTCVSYRCRLQFLPCIPTRRVQSIHSSGNKTQLRFAPFLAVMDVRNTVVQLPSWFWDYNPEHPRQSDQVLRLHKIFKLIGVVGFVALNSSIGLQAIGYSLVSQSVIDFLTIIGSCASLIFTGVCISMFQRQLLWAVITSFDFIFNSAQIVVVYLSILDMYRWKRTMLLPLVADWIWTMWTMCWDAMTPPVRRRLGLSHRFSACIGSSLIAFVTVNGVLIFFVAPLQAVNNRVLWHMDLWGHRIEFNAVSWYFSCVGTIASSAIRVVWRKWGAVENELVSLDGPVVFERPARRRAVASPHSPGQQTTTVQPPRILLPVGITN